MVAESRSSCHQIPAVLRVHSFCLLASPTIPKKLAKRRLVRAVLWPPDDGLSVDSDAVVCEIRAGNRRTQCRCRTIRDQKIGRQSCWRCRAIHLRVSSMAMHIRSPIRALAVPVASIHSSRSVVYIRTRRWANPATPAPCQSRSKNRPFRW